MITITELKLVLTNFENWVSKICSIRVLNLEIPKVHGINLYWIREPSSDYQLKDRISNPISTQNSSYLNNLKTLIMS